MSNNPETDLDLEKLLLPAWAQESPSINRYAKYEGGPEDDRGERRGRAGDRFDRRDPRGGERRERPPGPAGGAPFGRGRPGGPRRQDRGPRPRPQGQGPDREERREQRLQPPPPLPEIGVSIRPEEFGADSLARQIKVTGRAYPLFEIAQLVLQKPERHLFTFTVEKKPDGTVAHPLFLCALDDTLWLSEEEAVAHVLDRHFGTFYQAERTATEPPKGKYTFVAQCGMSGVILGPPNYHDYQDALRKLHTERFAKLPFEVFKSRVKIVRDEAVVKKWVDDQSWKTEYVCLNVPEATRLASREAVEKHFREVHLPNIIKPVEGHTLTGKAARALRSPGLSRLVRSVWEDQRRFPLQISTTLSQQFASRGLQFFKVNRTVTHVSVARPRFLDLETTPVSHGIRSIVEFINANPKSTRRQLIESLAPTPAAPPSAVSAAEPAPAEGAGPSTESAASAPAPTTPSAVPEPTPEQTAVIADLHWLVHQGHVIEFANGVLETAKRPIPKPPKPETMSPAPEAKAQAGTEPVQPADSVVSAEGVQVSGEAAEAAAPANAEPSAPAEPEPICAPVLDTPPTAACPADASTPAPEPAAAPTPSAPQP